MQGDRSGRKFHPQEPANNKSQHPNLETGNYDKTGTSSWPPRGGKPTHSARQLLAPQSMSHCNQVCAAQLEPAVLSTDRGERANQAARPVLAQLTWKLEGPGQPMDGVQLWIEP